jgi:hypothetical protein
MVAQEWYMLWPITNVQMLTNGYYLFDHQNGWKKKIKKILCFIIHICFYNLDLN